jgi:hypothetical protein
MATLSRTICVYSYHGPPVCKRSSNEIKDDSIGENRSFADAEIYVPDGFRGSNKCCWPLIASARANVGVGTALGVAVGCEKP